jgi:hypothetical protein
MCIVSGWQSLVISIGLVGGCFVLYGISEFGNWGFRRLRNGGAEELDNRILTAGQGEALIENGDSSNGS